MRQSTRFSRLAALLTLLLLAGTVPAAAQNQTNDPLVDEQQYLFDVHNLDQAWTYTTGSSNVKIGVYSMLGFIQNHEDLSSSRVLAPQGGDVEPELDFASEMVGIAGADTDNGLGMAGVDRAARFQSYSLLEQGQPTSSKPEEATIERQNGTFETFRYNVNDYADLLSQGRSNGVDVHLFTYGLPTASLRPIRWDIRPKIPLRA